MNIPLPQQPSSCTLVALPQNCEPITLMAVSWTTEDVWTVWQTDRQMYGNVRVYKILCLSPGRRIYVYLIPMDESFEAPGFGPWFG
jgi:hypothetical protein